MTLESGDNAIRAGKRIPALDIARGIALLTMIIYHLAWDLSFLGLIDGDIRDVPAWTWFARAIAASFLLLSGIGLVLAHQAGWNRAAFLNRLGLIAGAALLVTAGTYFAFPGNFVFFGILHAIAASSVLALPFLRLPAWLALAAAILVLALPEVVHLEVFDAPWLVWLGLGARVPATNDFVPIFPWFGFVLLGLALARSFDITRLAGFAGGSGPARLLAGAGRRSLVIYLLHQPILFGALILVAMALAPKPEQEARGFISSCQAQCRTTGSEPALCVRLCQCAVDGLKAERLWGAALADDPSPSLRERIGAISRRCAEMSVMSRPAP